MGCETGQCNKASTKTSPMINASTLSQWYGTIKLNLEKKCKSSWKMVFI